MDLYNLDIPGGSEWIRIWLTGLAFLFFFTLFFVFVSFRSLPLLKLTPPVEFATGPRLFSFSLYCHYPLSRRLDEGPSRLFSSFIYYDREIRV